MVPTKQDVGGLTVRNGVRRWAILALVATSVMLGMSVWLTAAAIGDVLQAKWSLGSSQVGWLVTAVQLGFVLGAFVAAIFNLVDIFPERTYFSCSAVLAGLTNGGLLLVGDYESALVLRFLTGFFLAGVYPPSMKMISTWFKASRGLAIGTIVGALTLGKASPYLFKVIGNSSFSMVILGTSLAALASGVLVGFYYYDGPHGFKRSSFSWRHIVTVVSHRPTRLATYGYLGHMWELYAMWTWAPAFIVASFSVNSGQEFSGGLLEWADITAFAVISIGGLGCIWGGIAADKIGRRKVVNLSMLISGSCCVAVGFLFGQTPWLLIPLMLIWGFFVVADSAQFSAMVTEIAPQDAVGTALTLQTSLGFLLTMATIQGTPFLTELVGWRWSFAFLSLGPLLGIVSIRRLDASYSDDG